MSIHLVNRRHQLGIGTEGLLRPALCLTRRITLELNFTPSTGTCEIDCKSAFQQLAESPCDHQGGEQNVMTTTASLSVGCGTFSYNISGPSTQIQAAPPVPKLSAQYCFPRDDFGKHGDIHSEWQSRFTGFLCTDSANENFGAGDKKNFDTTMNGVPYNYNLVAGWVL